MGNCNCLISQDKSVRVTKIDGKIIEYKAPIKVHQVLSEFHHHAISDELPEVNHMHPNSEMRQGHLYYLLPMPLTTPQQSKKKAKKAVRFSDDVTELEETQKTSRVVRIKLVITKQELLAMLREDTKDIISQMPKESTRRWSPVTLETISEVN